MIISISLADESPEHLEHREEAAEKRRILEKLKEMLGNLREKYHKAAEAAKHAIQQQMLLVKQRFNKIYKVLHGETYYAVSGDTNVIINQI